MTTKAATPKTNKPRTKKKAKAPLIALVCGSRAFNDYDYLASVLDKFAITGIVHGDADGADTLAQKYADANKIRTARHPITADHWKRFGKRAGILRNQAMLDFHPTITICIAFPIAAAAGTRDMIQRSRKAFIETAVFVSGSFSLNRQRTLQASKHS